MNWMGIDLGTTGCKSVVLTGSGQVLAEHYAEYELDYTPEGYIQQDAELWWQLVCQVIMASTAAVGPQEAARIQGLGISSQGISFVPVDAAGDSLGPAISWLDNRALAQTEQIGERFSESDLFRRTGKRLSPAYTLPKLMWLKAHERAIYDRAQLFLMPLDFITRRLTGKTCTDYAMASGTMAFNIQTGSWDQDILAACGIEAAKLPPVAVAGSRVGPVRPDLCARLGLAAGLPVYLGTQDQKCAALAAGVGPGVATVSLGTASAITTLSQTPLFDPALRIPVFALGDQRWVLESVIGTASVTLKWLRTTLMTDLTYEQLDQLARQVPAGANGVCFYPHFEGAGSPFWRSDIRGSYQGLSLAVQRADLVRALLEGIAYQIYTNVLVQEDITGQAIHTIRLFGGGSKSDLWCAIIAAVTGRLVEQMEPELANLGAGLLAQEKDDPSTRDAIGRPLKSHQPQAQEQARYQSLYTQYRETEDHIMKQ